MDFGEYALIEQKRYGVPNEMYLHKVIGTRRSNSWVDVPVQTPAAETLHHECVDVVSCICCGVDERHVLQYRADDLRGAPIRPNVEVSGAARLYRAASGGPQGYADATRIKISSVLPEIFIE